MLAATFLKSTGSRVMTLTETQPASTWLLAAKDSTVHETNLNYKLERYCDWLRLKGMAPSTIRVYRSRIQQFVSFTDKLIDHQFPSDLDIIESLALFTGRLYETMTPRSANCYLTALESFLGFIGIERKFERGKLTPPARRYLSMDEVESLRHVLELRASPRDRMLVYMFLYGGLRLSECLQTRTSHILFHQGRFMIRIEDARSSHRHWVLHPSTTSALVSWLWIRQSTIHNPDEQALFITRSGKPMKEATVDYLLRSNGWKANLEISARVLRNTCLQHSLFEELRGERTKEVTEVTPLFRQTLPPDSPPGRGLSTRFWQMPLILEHAKIIGSEGKPAP